jgi:hypothetical protein
MIANLSLPLQICLFALIGTLEDYIVSLYYRAIADRMALRASAISVFHTLMAVFVVGNCITSNSIWPLVAYALGGGIGTYAGVKWNRK